MRLAVSFATGLVLAGVVFAADQTPPPSPAPLSQQAPVFRTGTDIVPISVTVLDRKGQPVTDLTQADFTVIENKKPRDIISFFLQRYEPGPVPPASNAINRVRDESIRPQTRRTFLIMLGYGRIQWPTNALDGAIELVRHRLLPQDAVAVMGFHRVTNFTTDHEAVARILERYKRDHEKIVLDINWWLFMATPPVGHGHAPIPDSFLKRIDDVFLGPSAGEGARPPSSISLRRIADLMLGMDRAVPVVEKPWERQDRFADIQGDLRWEGVELNDAVLTSSRLKVFAGIEYLRYLEGDKHMVVFANGGLVRRDPERRADHDVLLMMQRATDARVVLDLVSTIGTFERGGGGGDEWGRELAERTGGFYSSVDMAVKAVAKIDNGTRFSYLLGYEPSSPTLDGKYRDVEVKVNRPDVTVLFRHGYYAAAEPEPLELKEFIVKSRVETALAYDNSAKDIPLKVSASVLPRMGVTAQVRVDITIDANSLALTLKDGQYTGQLELQAYIGDAKQNAIGEFGARLDLDATGDTRAQWMASGIRRTLRVPYTGAPKYVKVIVYDYGSDRAGSFMLTLK